MSRASHLTLRSSFVLGIIVFLIAALAGCGSENSVSSTDSLTGRALSPLEQRLGFSSDADARQRQLITLQREADAEVVRCMAAQGFDYESAPISQAVLIGEAANDGTRSWAEENGLGITQSFLSAREAIDRQPDAQDPNAAYLASLSPARVDEYSRALFGPVGEPAAADQPFAYEPGGCQGASFAGAFAHLGLLDAFENELASLNSRMASDPRVLRFVDQWSACMTGQGHRYLDRDEMADDVYARLLTIDGFTNEQVSVDASSVPVVELLAFERSVALASFECSRPFEQAMIEIRAAYESEFIDDHRSRIDALVSAE